MSRARLVTTFEVDKTIQPIYTGGDVALDNKGRILASCIGEDVVLTDITTGRFLARIEGDGEVLTAIALTPTASHLATCSRSLSMRVYEIQSQDDSDQPVEATLKRTLKPHASPVTAIAVDETSSLLATGSADSVVKVWDIRSGYSTHTFRGHSGVISALRFFETSHEDQNHRKNGKLPASSVNNSDLSSSEARKFFLSSGSEDGKIRIWDLVKRKSVAQLNSHVSVVRSFDGFAPLDIFVSASRDRTIVVWDTKTWKAQRVIPVLEEVESVALLRNGSVAATGGQHGAVRLWSLASGTEITTETPSGSESDAIISMISKEASDYILSIHADQVLKFHSLSLIDRDLLDASTIDPLPIIRQVSGTHDEVIDMAFVGRDHSFLALATNTESIRVVSVARHDESATPSEATTYFGADVASLTGHDEIVVGVSVDWSGHWLATGAKDNTVRIWRVDPANGLFEQYCVCSGHAESVGAVAFPSLTPQPDSKAAKTPLQHPPSFLISGSQDSTIKHWTIGSPGSTPSARATYTRKAHDKDINALSVSPDSRLFASASQDRTVKIWSTEHGETQGILRGHKRGVWTVTFSPKDVLSISGETGNTATNRGMVLTGSGDKTIKIWSLNDYSCIRTFEGHTNSVLKVLWLPASSTSTDSSSSNPSDSSGTSPRQSYNIASAGGDGLVKIWDPRTGECSTTLDNHSDRVWALTLEPRGQDRNLVSGGGDGTITFWRDTSSQTLAARESASTARVEQDQDLLNRIQNREYREAITLALALDHPARLLGLFQSVLDHRDNDREARPEDAASITGINAVDDVIASLSDDQLLSLLKRVRDWNTNARTCAVAQRVLNVVVRKYSAERIARLAKKRGGREVVEALRAYTERHFERVEELWGESWIVEFVLSEMGTIVGDESENQGERMEGIVSGRGSGQAEDVVVV